MPGNFAPGFQKEYNLHDYTYQVQIQNRGLADENPSIVPHLVWLFRVRVNEIPVEEGVFRWDPSDRKLSDEEVADQVAAFYGHSEQVTNAAQL